MARENLQQIIAQNITLLRRANGMTQAGLAEKLGYSDKSVSKWERADGVPDILCLKTMADLFGVTVDYMLTAEHPEPAPETPAAEEVETAVPGNIRRAEREYTVSRRNIALLSVAGVWFLAVIASVVILLAGGGAHAFVLPFAAALPITGLLLVIFNSLWGTRAWQFFAVTSLVLSVLFLTCYLLYPIHPEAWLLMLAGLPGALVVWLSCRVRKIAEPTPLPTPDGEKTDPPS